MSLSLENETIITKRIATKIETVPEAGIAIPSPIYFQDRADFLAVFDPEATQEAIETKPIAACWFYPILPDKERAGRGAIGSHHSPFFFLTYELYLFRGYRWTRADESELPADPFDQRILQQHRLFTKAWLDIDAEFVGHQRIPGLSTETYKIARWTNITFPTAIEDRAQCKFIPGLFGFAIRMHQRVELLTEAC